MPSITSSYRHKNKPLPGFTLIEILVVIGIIGVLSMVTSVAVASTHAKARNAVRRHDVRVIRDALIRYQHDHQGSLPTGIDNRTRMLGTAATGCDQCGGAAPPPVEPVTVTLYPTDDAAIFAYPGSDNYGRDATLWTYPWTASYSRRSLLKFDFNGLPAGARINSANLYLRQSGTYGFTSTIALHYALADWSEGTVTWSNQPGFANFSTSLATLNWSGTLGSTSWNVLPDIAAFMSGELRNYGWVIKNVTEDSSQYWWSFYSKEGSVSPYVEITYTLPPAGTPSSASCLNLAGVMVAEYLSEIPADPQSKTDDRAWYTVQQTNSGELTVNACAAELGETIAAQGRY